MAVDRKALQKDLAVARSLRNKVEVLVRFAAAFRERGDLEQAITLSEQAIGLAVQAEKDGQPYTAGLAESLALLGECLLESGNPAQALDTLLRALKEYEELGNEHQIARACICCWAKIMHTWKYLSKRANSSQRARGSRRRLRIAAY